MKRNSIWIIVASLMVVALVLLGLRSLASSTNDDAAVTPAVSDTQLADCTGAALPTMLELGSEGCIPCEKMKPVMAELAEAHGELIHIEFHDVRKNQEIAQQYRIRLIPTQIFLNTDGTEFFRHEGFFAREEIEQVFRDMGVAL